MVNIIFYCSAYCQVGNRYFFYLYKYVYLFSGVNKSDVPDYPRDPQQCAFFNNKFLIFSSLGSFFIPCIIIFAIYYRIFVVIMTQARKNRRQWRPKAIIESAAAQHRTNADTLITSYYNERQSVVNPLSGGGEQTSLTFPNDIHDNTQIRTLDTQRNSLMLKLTTPVLPSLCFQPDTQLSLSNEQINDDESLDESIQFNHQANGDKQIEVVTMNKTKSCSSQTDDQVPAHVSSKRSKTRLKSKSQSDASAVTAAVKTTANNVKLAKRKAYSRMKKERKATQTLIIVLSKLMNSSSEEKRKDKNFNVKINPMKITSTILSLFLIL